MTNEHTTSILSDAVSAAFAELQREITELKRRVQRLEESGGRSVDPPPSVIGSSPMR